VAHGFESEAFGEAFRSEAAYQRVKMDRSEAQKLGIRSVPTLIVSSSQSGDVLGQLQTISAGNLRSSLQAMMSVSLLSKA